MNPFDRRLANERTANRATFFIVALFVLLAVVVFYSAARAGSQWRCVVVQEGR